MATTPTQLPIPSEKPQDLKFNAGKIDEFVTSKGWTYTDRFGVKHYTIEGLKHIAEQAISAFGYITMDSFQAGATLTLPNQVLRDISTGEYYRWDGVFPKSVAAGSTPDSSGGIGSGKWLSIGDAALRQNLASSGDGLGDALIGVKQPFTGSAVRTQHDKNADYVMVTDFGAKGDYVTDDREAILFGDSYCASTGKTLYFPSGVYRSSDGIDKKAKWVGTGSPALGVFPIEDDKKYLRPGFKNKIPGTSIVFSGSGTQTLSTQRTDDFSSFSYCVKCDVFGSSMEGMAIVMDMDVYDAGGTLTTPSTDNRSTYSVGYVINDAAQNYHRDIAVFGYFGVAGTVILSFAGNDDPDYNVFHHGSSMGKRGVALIGYQDSSVGISGLSGTQFISFDIFSNDHHSCSAATAASLYADAGSWRCLYIDGYTSAATANINGHYFFGGCIRSYINNTIELDHASHISFNGTVFETPLYAVPNSNVTQYLASANTTDVSFITTRHSNDGGMANAAFGGSLIGQLIVVGGPGNLTAGILVAKKDPASSTCYWIKMGADGGTGDPALQMGSGTFGVSSSGWSLRRSISGGDNLDINYNGTTRLRVDKNGGQQKLAFATGGAKTIALGSITVAEYNFYSVDTEGAAATDDLDTISGGTVNGQILVLMAANSNRDVVLKDGTGNLRLTADFTLTYAQDRIMLMFDGTNWCELSRADNTP